MQGRNMTALGEDSAAYAGGPHKDSVARLIFSLPYCRTLNVGMLTVHIAVGSMVGPTLAGCKGLKAVTCRLVQRLDAPLRVDRARVVVEVLGGSMEAD
jgi:hypothetical protein